MGKKKNAAVMIDDTINTDDIYKTHQQIKKIVESYKEVNKRVDKITRTVNENWVGLGQIEFESQYNILIKKIDDFGDTLQDIYDALIDAEAAYETQDDNLRKDFVKSASSMK